MNSRHALTALVLALFAMPALALSHTAGGAALGHPFDDAPARVGADHEVAGRVPAASEAPAVDPDRANELAVDAYRKGELDTARARWTELLAAPASDPERARLCYDLGNVAFRQQHALEAVGWYTASLRLRPRDADTWANLEHARRESGLEPADRGDLGATLARVVSAFTRAESERIAALGALAWAVLLAFEAVRGGAVWRRLAWIGALGVLAAFAPLGWHLVHDAKDPMLAIAPKEHPLTLHSEPRNDAAVIAEVAPGEELERVDSLPDWTAVELSNGTRGWARSDAVFALER